MGMGMAKPSAGFHTSLRSTAAAVRSSAGSSSSDPTLPAPTSIPRADLSSSSAKAVVVSTNRRSVGSSSSASAGDLPAPTPRDLASVAKVVAKRLAYDDDLTFPTAASTLPEEGDLVPLLQLPDPDDASSFTVISASPDDAMASSADSTVTEPSTPVRSPANNDAQESHTIGVADEHIGAVVGRAGRNITEIIQASGARIKISDRGDFIAGTSDRKVTITVTPEAIQAAESMIMQRVSASSER